MQDRRFEFKGAGSSSCPSPKRKLEQDDNIQPRKRHNSNLDEVCDSRGSSSEESLLDTIVKPSCSHAQPLQFSIKNDVGNFAYKLQISDEQKYQLLRNHFIPNKKFVFPVTKYGGRNRTFQSTWLERYVGLVYSPSLNGCFCIYCFLFGSDDLGVLSSKPLLDMAHAHDRLTKHFGKDDKEAKKSHEFAREKALNFLAVMENTKDDIRTQSNTKKAEVVRKNREILSSVIKCVILCGRQNLPLRGHRDDSQHVGDKNTNSGNFQALLYFRIDSGDVNLKRYLENCPRNATYRSKTIQNEIIDCIKDCIVDDLLAEVKDSGFYSISADEKADISNTKQLSICLRFVDKSSNIREVFMGFLDVTPDTSGKSIAENILLTLTDWGLDIQDCRGQTYDGAGNMAGKINGAAAIITNTNAKALYTHCNSHCLNLVLNQCAKSPLVRNMLDTAEKVFNFYKFSPKRNNNLESWIDKLCDTKKHKLIEMCRTRFVERHNAFEVFLVLYSAIEASLTEMMSSRNFNRETSSESSTLHAAITNFQFLITLVIVKNCMAFTRGLSTKLQGRTLDIVAAYKSVSVVKEAITDKVIKMARPNKVKNSKAGSTEFTTENNLQHKRNYP
ncbi:52 kDa repressor of the inhibitor of the protein kinase-like [Mytilus trossulus]|uniref:52 kDa repressor of the inhibitor of the protein kinase-like n=1 Tax=Mytilus trossulus TaxID=6551 RepID=UPI003007A13C